MKTLGESLLFLPLGRYLGMGSHRERGPFSSPSLGCSKGVLQAEGKDDFWIPSPPEALAWSAVVGVGSDRPGKKPKDSPISCAPRNERMGRANQNRK